MIMLVISMTKMLVAKSHPHGTPPQNSTHPLRVIGAVKRTLRQRRLCCGAEKTRNTTMLRTKAITNEQMPNSGFDKFFYKKRYEQVQMTLYKQHELCTFQIEAVEVPAL